MKKSKKQRIANKRTKITNRKLVRKYPWLLPRNRWTDKVPDDYDYSYTELDAMPDGWREAFGETMVEEIDEELKKYNLRNKYRIIQIKEKYGELRWYDNGAPKSIHNIIAKYEIISQNVCIRCGKLDVPMTGKSWINPYCFDCYYKNYKSREKYFNSGDFKTKEEVFEIYKNDCCDEINKNGNCFIPDS